MTNPIPAEAPARTTRVIVDPELDDITDDPVDDSTATEDAEYEHDGLPDELPPLPDDADMDLTRDAVVPDDDGEGFDDPEGGL